MSLLSFVEGQIAEQRFQTLPGHRFDSHTNGHPIFNPNFVVNACVGQLLGLLQQCLLVFNLGIFVVLKRETKMFPNLECHFVHAVHVGHVFEHFWLVPECPNACSGCVCNLGEDGAQGPFQVGDEIGSQNQVHHQLFGLI